MPNAATVNSEKISDWILLVIGDSVHILGDCSELFPLIEEDGHSRPKHLITLEVIRFPIVFGPKQVTVNFRFQNHFSVGSEGESGSPPTELIAKHKMPWVFKYIEFQKGSYGMGKSPFHVKIVESL